MLQYIRQQSLQGDENCLYWTWYYDEFCYAFNDCVELKDSDISLSGKEKNETASIDTTY